MLYILPMVVLQVKTYLCYETINKTILSFLDAYLTRCVYLWIVQKTELFCSHLMESKQSSVEDDSALDVELDAKSLSLVQES